MPGNHAEATPGAPQPLKERSVLARRRNLVALADSVGAVVQDLGETTSAKGDRKAERFDDPCIASIGAGTLAPATAKARE